MELVNYRKDYQVIRCYCTVCIQTVGTTVLMSDQSKEFLDWVQCSSTSGRIGVCALVYP